jgi:hypothetical protein
LQGSTPCLQIPGIPAADHEKREALPAVISVPTVPYFSFQGRNDFFGPIYNPALDSRHLSSPQRSLIFVNAGLVK